MSEEFRPGAGDRLLDRVEKDKSGHLKKLVSDLLESVRQLSKLNRPMDEIASTVSLAWYVGQNPDLEGLLDAMTSLNNPDENSYN